MQALQHFARQAKQNNEPAKSTKGFYSKQYTLTVVTFKEAVEEIDLAAGRSCFLTSSSGRLQLGQRTARVAVLELERSLTSSWIGSLAQAVRSR